MLLHRPALNEQLIANLCVSSVKFLSHREDWHQIQGLTRVFQHEANIGWQENHDIGVFIKNYITNLLEIDFYVE